MSDHVTDEMVETAARTEWDVVWGDVIDWDEADPKSREMFSRGIRPALEAVAPQIAAAAWAEGYAAAQLEWKHLYDGHTIDPDADESMCTECGKGNPYA